MKTSQAETTQNPVSMRDALAAISSMVLGLFSIMLLFVALFQQFAF